MFREILTTITDLKDTRKLAETLSQHCKIGDVILLKGDLGSGKTTFAQFFIKNLCDVDDVNSPTFNILSIYEGKEVTVYHYDLYRLKSQNDLHELAIEEAFSSAISLIEWPEYLESIMLKDKIVIYFNCNFKQNLRNASVKLYGRFAEEKRLLEKLTQQ